MTPEGALRIFKRKPTSLSHFVFCYFLSFPSRLQLHFRVSLCSGLTSSMPLQGSSNTAPSPCQPAQFRANFSIHSLPRGYYQGLVQSCICKHSRVCIRLYISMCVWAEEPRTLTRLSVRAAPPGATAPEGSGAGGAARAGGSSGSASAGATDPTGTC